MSSKPSKVIPIFLANNNDNGHIANEHNAVMSPEKLNYEEKEEGNYYLKDGKYEKAKGLHWFVTGLFVVGDLAGGGLVAMPTAMIRFGFAMGLFFIALVTLITCYTSHLLGRNWLIMQRRWPSVYASGHCRKPYPEMAQRAVGSHIRHFVSICINITQFGIAVVYLLLSSRNIQGFLYTFFSVNIGYCGIVLIVALALLPITFLKSPQDFWAIVVVGMFTTALAVILVVVGALLDYPTCSDHVGEIEFKATNYFLALGTFVFSYGGHAVFPTIQHDMRKPHEFTKSSILAFAIVTAMYTPVCIVGYITYGDSLRDSIIESLQSSQIQMCVNILITIHCILTLTIVFNPMNQEAEEYFNVPHHFGVKRILVRTAMMCMVVFVAETLPNFGPLLDLVGGSTLTLTSLIFPTVFYLLLRTGEKKVIERRDALAGEKGRMSSTMNTYVVRPNQMKNDIFSEEEDQIRPSFTEVLRQTDKGTLCLCAFIIGFAILGGSAATFSAVRELSTVNFVPPCYVAMFMHENKSSSDEATGHTVCCGSDQRLSRFAHTPEEINKFCSPKPEHNKYL